MEAFSYVFVDFWGTKFERKMFCRLFSSMIECVDGDDKGWYLFSSEEGEDYISIAPGELAMGESLIEDDDIICSGKDIANVFATVFPHSHFVYFAYIDLTYNGSGTEVIMVKYDGKNMLVFGPEYEIETELYEDNETEEDESFGFNPDVVKAIKSRIESGQNVFGIKYYQEYERDGDFTVIMDTLNRYQALAIEYVSSPAIIQPELNKVFIRTSYPDIDGEIVMEPKILMLHAMEEQLNDKENPGGVTDYLKLLPEEMITSVIKCCNVEGYPHAVTELQRELERRK